MKKYKNGKSITKEFNEMTLDELLAVDISTLTFEELVEHNKWLEIYEKIFVDTMSY